LLAACYQEVTRILGVVLVKCDSPVSLARNYYVVPAGRPFAARAYERLVHRNGDGRRAMNAVDYLTQDVFDVSKGFSGRISPGLPRQTFESDHRASGRKRALTCGLKLVEHRM